MARLIKFEATRTYATEANAIKAVEKKGISDDYRYFIYRDEATGRFYPIFVGEKALNAGIHFLFHVVA